MQSSKFAFGESDSDEGDADSCGELDVTKAFSQGGSTQVAKPPSRPQTKRRIFVEDKQKKNIDEFLTKIKAQQSRRADGTAPVAAPPIRGIGAAAELDDPMTTNVYVGNLVRLFVPHQFISRGVSLPPPSRVGASSGALY